MNEKYGLKHGFVNHYCRLCVYQYGIPHRIDKPASYGEDDLIEYYQYGMKHNINGPAVKTNIHVEFYQYGKIHNKNEPAFQWDGCNIKSIQFYQYGLRHKQNGTAYYYKDSFDDKKEFSQYDLPHNTNGPAIIKANKELYYKYGRKIKIKSNWKLGL